MLHVAVCEDNGSLLADIKEKVQKYLKEIISWRWWKHMTAVIC